MARDSLTSATATVPSGANTWTYYALTADGFEIETQLVLGAVKAGLEIRETPSFELQRRAGVSNLNAARDGIRVLRTMLGRATCGAIPQRSISPSGRSTCLSGTPIGSPPPVSAGGSIGAGSVAPHPATPGRSRMSTSAGAQSARSSPTARTTSRRHISSQRDSRDSRRCSPHSAGLSASRRRRRRRAVQRRGVHGGLSASTAPPGQYGCGGVALWTSSGSSTQEPVLRRRGLPCGPRQRVWNIARGVGQADGRDRIAPNPRQRRGAQLRAASAGRLATHLRAQDTCDEACHSGAQQAVGAERHRRGPDQLSQVFCQRGERARECLDTQGLRGG